MRVLYRKLIKSLYNGGMNDVKIGSNHSQRPNVREQSRCCETATIIKITLIIAGLLLISASIVSYFYHLNSTVVYSMGGGGALLILGSIVGSIIHCVCLIKARAKTIEEARLKVKKDEAILDDKKKWLELAGKGDMQAIEEALKNNTLSANLDQLLYVAVKNCQKDLVSFLLDKGANPNPDEGHSILHVAAGSDEVKSLEIMEVILTKKPELVSLAVGSSKVTPLHLAANRGEIKKDIYQKKIRLLIEKRADVKTKDSKDDTPLHNMALGTFTEPPDIEMIELLVAKGAQWDAINQEGKTPLQIAMKFQSQWCKSQAIKPRLKALKKK